MQTLTGLTKDKPFLPKTNSLKVKVYFILWPCVAFWSGKLHICWYQYKLGNNNRE